MGWLWCRELRLLGRSSVKDQGERGREVEKGQYWGILTKNYLSNESHTHILALTLLLLQLERDTSNGTLLNSLHQMSGESSNLVSQSLGRNDGDFIADSLVGVEIQC